MMESQDFWKKCSNCKKPIGFLTKYWVCNVSTCNRKRTGLSFCSVACWDAHVPMMNHRESWAEERTAPSKQKFLAESQGLSESPPVAKAPPENPGFAKTAGSISVAPLAPSDWNDEILVVASKVKSYIREVSGMNTSDRVMQILSYQVRQWADEAIAKARTQGRQTVMDRDI